MRSAGQCAAGINGSRQLFRRFAVAYLLSLATAPRGLGCRRFCRAGEALAPDAVANVVAGLRDDPEARQLDTLVLACTHFPLLADELRAVFGEKVQLLDGAQGIARRIAHLTEGQEFSRQRPDPAITTGPLADLDALDSALAAYGLTDKSRF